MFLELQTCGWHGGPVVSIVVSQSEILGSNPPAVWGLSMWHLHVLLLPVWVLQLLPTDQKHAG